MDIDDLDIQFKNVTDSINVEIREYLAEKYKLRKYISDIEKEIKDKSKAKTDKNRWLREKKKELKKIEEIDGVEDKRHSEKNKQAIEALTKEVDGINEEVKKLGKEIRELKREQEHYIDKLENKIDEYLMLNIKGKTVNLENNFESTKKILFALADENDKLNESLKAKRTELENKENQRREENVRNAETINKYDNMIRKIKDDLKIEFEEFEESENDEMTIGLGNNLRLIIKNIKDIITKLNSFRD